MQLCASAARLQENNAMWLVEKVVVAEVAVDGKLTSKSGPRAGCSGLACVRLSRTR